MVVVFGGCGFLLVLWFLVVVCGSLFVGCGVVLFGGVVLGCGGVVVVWVVCGVGVVGLWFGLCFVWVVWFLVFVVVCGLVVVFGLWLVVVWVGLLVFVWLVWLLVFVVVLGCGVLFGVVMMSEFGWWWLVVGSCLSSK